MERPMRSWFKKLSLPIIAALFFLAANTAFALTLSDIETIVRRNVRDTATDTTLQRYSDSVIDEFINEAQAVVVNETWCLKLSTAITLSAGTTFYSLPNDFIAAYQVNFLNNSNQWDELEEISEKILYDTNPDFEHGGANTPTEYFIRYSTYGANALEVGFTPTPSSTSTGTVRIDYYNQSTDLSSDSDVPFDGNRNLYPYHRTTIPNYATFRIKSVEGKIDEAETYYGLYEKHIENMKERFRQSPNYHPAVKAAPR